MIRGRAMGAAPIEHIRLQVGDWVTSTASFGQPERASVAVMPDGTLGRQRAFQFNLPRPGDGRTEKCGFQIVARTLDGFEYAETFEITIDHSAANIVSVTAGPTRPFPGGGRPFTVLYIERGTIDADGVLVLLGWAVALAPTLAVNVFADEDRIAKATIGGERDDVAGVFPAYPNARLSGFSLTCQLDPANRDAGRVRAQMVCPNGFGHEESIPVERLRRRGSHHIAGQDAPQEDASPAFALFNQAPVYQLSADFRIADDPLFGLVLPGAAPGGTSSPGPARHDMAPAGLAPPPGPGPSTEIRMHCDAAELSGNGILSVNGWAVSGAGIVQVRVLLNGEPVGLASFGHERPDVGEIFPAIPMSHLSGFRFERRIGDGFAGEHEVCVIVRNMRDAEDERQIKVVATEVTERDPDGVADVRQTADGPELTPDQSAEFRFELDSPPVANGVAVALVTGRLTIDGWLLSRSGIASFEIFLDDQRLGDAHYGLARQDVGAAFPEWPNSLRSGFAFHCPPRSLRDGEHRVEVRIRANNNVALTRGFRITVKKAEELKDSVGIRRRVARVEADMMTGFLADMAYRPSFRFILRLDEPIAPERVRATLRALRLQAYPDWTVRILAAGDSVAGAVKLLVDDFAPDLADRFSVITPRDAAAWSAPLAQPDMTGSGDGRVLYALLLAGDEPGADALLELAFAAGRHPDRDLLYGDEMRISPVSEENEAFFKPDFSPTCCCRRTTSAGRGWRRTCFWRAPAHRPRA